MFTKIENVKKPPFFVVFEHRLYCLVFKTLHQNIFSILPNPFFIISNSDLF